jgi:hypothetical protein
MPRFKARQARQVNLEARVQKRHGPRLPFAELLGEGRTGAEHAAQRYRGKSKLVRKSTRH